jgi:hypothetical protein
MLARVCMCHQKSNARNNPRDTSTFLYDISDLLQLHGRETHAPKSNTHLTRYEDLTDGLMKMQFMEFYAMLIYLLTDIFQALRCSETSEIVNRHGVASQNTQILTYFWQALHCARVFAVLSRAIPSS